MPDISAYPQPTLGRVLIQIAWGDIPAVTNAGVTRVEADGTTVPVRATTAVDSSGDEMELSGGLAVLYDTEAPMDETLYYITSSSQSTSTATSDTLTMLSSGYPWLKSPLHPWQDKRLLLSGKFSSPDCEEGDEIYFSQMADEVRSGRSNAFSVNQRKNPIPAPRTRGGITSALRVVSRTFAARDSVIELNASGDPLFFQAPEKYGIPDRYMIVGDYQVQRLSPDHRQPWRANIMPHVEVDRPDGLADGVLGNRWADLCDQGTFAQAEAAGLTWTKIMLGYGSTPPTNPDFRLYSDIPIDFATYGDIPTGGRTYVDILEGN